MDSLLFNREELSLQLFQENPTEVKEIITIKALNQGLDNSMVFLLFPDNSFSECKSLQQSKSSLNGKNKDYLKKKKNL